MRSAECCVGSWPQLIVRFLEVSAVARVAPMTCLNIHAMNLPISWQPTSGGSLYPNAFSGKKIRASLAACALWATAGKPRLLLRLGWVHGPNVRLRELCVPAGEIRLESVSRDCFDGGP